MFKEPKVGIGVKARTRLRGEVMYWDADWFIPNNGSGRNVTFLNGPHNGNTYPESMCVIAKDEEWKLGARIS